MARYGEVKQRPHLFSSRKHNLPSKVGYVTNKLHGTESLHVDATIKRSFQTGLFSSFLLSTYASNLNLAVAKPWQFMPNWKDGSTVEFIIMFFVSTYISCHIL